MYLYSTWRHIDSTLDPCQHQILGPMANKTLSVPDLIKKRDTLQHELDDVEMELERRKNEINTIIETLKQLHPLLTPSSTPSSPQLNTKGTLYYVLTPYTACRHGNKEDEAKCNDC